MIRAWLVCIALAWVGSACGASAAELRVGATVTKITPPLGVPLAGYYHARGADGVLDDLYARTLVVEQGGETAAFVVLDLISTTRTLVEQSRTEIAKRTGVKGASVMISATHTHTGPELKGRGRRTDDLAVGGDLVSKYVEQLPALIAESVKQAQSNLAPAKLSAAIGREEHLSYNRRYKMRDGTVGWNPGKGNPNIVAPAGAIDPDVGVLYAETIGETGKPGRPIAMYINFAHAPGHGWRDEVFGGLSGRRSARCWRATRCKDMVTVFANGACGNLNHVDVNWDGAAKGSVRGASHRRGAGGGRVASHQAAQTG